MQSSYIQCYDVHVSLVSLSTDFIHMFLVIVAVIVSCMNGFSTFLYFLSRSYKVSCDKIYKVSLLCPHKSDVCYFFKYDSSPLWCVIN